MPPRAAPTHFLCLPLVTSLSRPQLAKSLAAFSADVTSQDSFAVPEQAVRPLGTLHLTLGVMSFPDGHGLDGAIALLKSLVSSPATSSLLRPTVADQHPPSTQHQQQQQQPLLTISLKGLHSIQPPAKASVLYAPPVDEEGSLFQLCRHLRTAFQDAGYIETEDRPLLLHATIVNTIYVKSNKNARSGPASRGKRGEKLTIDARDILDRYDDHVWMTDVPLQKIAICKMGAKEQPDGEVAYEAEAEVELN